MGSARLEAKGPVTVSPGTPMDDETSPRECQVVRKHLEHRVDHYPQVDVACLSSLR